MPPLLVTAAIITHKGKILLTQRPHGKNHGGQWEFPGGKLEENESPVEGLKRELREEIGLEVSNCRIHEVVYHNYQWGPVLVMFYLCESRTNHIEHYQVLDHAWLYPQQLLDYDILPADKEMVTALATRPKP